MSEIYSTGILRKRTDRSWSVWLEFPRYSSRMLPEIREGELKYCNDEVLPGHQQYKALIVRYFLENFDKQASDGVNHTPRLIFAFLFCSLIVCEYSFPRKDSQFSQDEHQQLVTTLFNKYEVTSVRRCHWLTLILGRKIWSSRIFSSRVLPSFDVEFKAPPRMQRPQLSVLTSITLSSRWVTIHWIEY